MSQRENDWLLSSFAANESVWIGYTDQASEGSFAWITGEPVDYENWAVGDPDDALGADWALLQAGTGYWTDEPYLPAHPWVIEVVSLDCDNDGYPDAFQVAKQPWLDWNGNGNLNRCESPNYCTAAVNSSGAAAEIGASGSPLLGSSDFRLHASGMPLNELGYFLMSESSAFLQGFGGSSGNLCLGAPIIRFTQPGQLIDTGLMGLVELSLDLTQLPDGAVFLPGQVWNFQLWFRDALTSNTTDGIEVMFR